MGTPFHPQDTVPCLVVVGAKGREAPGFTRMERGCNSRMECWSSRGTLLVLTEEEMAEAPNTLLPSAIGEFR